MGSKVTNKMELTEYSCGTIGMMSQRPEKLKADMWQQGVSAPAVATAEEVSVQEILSVATEQDVVYLRGGRFIFLFAIWAEPPA